MQWIKSVFFICIVLIVFPLTAQNIPSEDRFGKKEMLRYQVIYHLGLLWIDAGKVDFNLTKSSENQGEVFNVVSTGTSNPQWDWLYTLRDTFEVKTLCKELKPLQFRRNTFEGGTHITEFYVFDHENQTVTIKHQENDDPMMRDTLSLETGLRDILTATYAARSMDFTYSLIGDTLELQLIHEGKKVNLPVIFRGREILTSTENEAVSCIHFSAIIKTGSLFIRGETVDVWVTDNSRQIPLLIEAKILIGSIKARLTKTESN